MPVASVIVRAGKAYVQIMGATDGGGYRATGPVQVIEPDVDGLAEALRRVLSEGNVKVRTPRSGSEMPQPDPMLKAAGVRSWLALARGAASYSVCWLDGRIELYMSQLDKRGRFVGDPAKTKILPPATDVRVIAELIVQDLRSRPEVDGGQA